MEVVKMKEVKITELKDEILARIAGGEEGEYQYLTKCCNKPPIYQWGKGGLDLVCSGCGKIAKEIYVIE